MLWVDFLNSEWHDWRGSGRYEDRLDQPAVVEQLLKEHGLPSIPSPGAEEMAELKLLRFAMREMVKAIVRGQEPELEALELLNRMMARGPVIRRIVRTDERFRLEQTAERADWAHTMAEIAASFARTLAEGETSRIRICDNPDCKWIYYDDTRNRSKRYCDDKACGNLLKVRRFRARQKASKEHPST
ncbi:MULTISPECIES: ABATE domain-containing protein [unclassified Paenibacillus]|uniref:CGNR zinc finger domain-containing protein n=1 Tax=unclassified Paenibacillus TaxID=185978 RepID=UPI001C111A6B|nr:MULTISPECIES: ABATE domain-containing protein [unclassified Paenibacillus]MBU5441307.1 ABATE domain-containing protein [Paenibacillus sp. MSJ-34]CAH0120873.1 hypothetical protein PAE9249_03397 [Paenibacillus sp. CECT 9249]